MVSTTENNPLVPKTMQTRKSLSDADGHPAAMQSHRLDDTEMNLIVDDVAPSSQSTCAELAHDHALEDLHKMTDHDFAADGGGLGQKRPGYSIGYLDHGTQCELGRPGD
ncbi:Uncharacterized protein PECH_005499 [Penicillium ucsense]|uniref:Uncharacterized protein n=1 Tax=Penicillium ucsense TaxID=2839758 RepID=A0A8J8WCX3_9EURO|nr:Uncharacterized protein PECM_005476 [Penicillium ucsense]KAF7736262.1 Uncharacterized protein PECH_005499 [Penicillium ucsense]